MKKVIAILTMTLLCVAAMCACTPKADALKKKYEKENYTVSVTKSEDLEKYSVDSTKIDYSFTANKGTDNVIVISFKNGDDATEYFNSCENNNLLKAALTLIGWKSKKSGNAVAIGTEEALKLL